MNMPKVINTRLTKQLRNRKKAILMPNILVYKKRCKLERLHVNKRRRKNKALREGKKLSFYFLIYSKRASA